MKNKNEEYEKMAELLSNIPRSVAKVWAEAQRRGICAEELLKIKDDFHFSAPFIPLLNDINAGKLTTAEINQRWGELYTQTHPEENQSEA